MLKLILGVTALLLCYPSWVMIICSFIIFSFFSLNQIWGYNLGVIDYLIVDHLSQSLIVLTLWVTALMFLASYTVHEESVFDTLFTSLVVALAVFLLLSFSGSDLMVFYIMFESTLIPIFLLILGWGYQPERIPASYYLLFYTLFASLPLLLGLLYLSSELGSMNFYLLGISRIEWGIPLVVAMILAFLVKMPIYFGHLWLPKAHVEAPVAGSMILAGVLLKLGGYGLFRVLPVLSLSLVAISPWVIAVSVMGGAVASLICMRETDAKSLIAYSSVAHMALVIVGLFLMSEGGWGGAWVIMLSHGLCSSALFALVGVVYARLHTRSLYLMQSGIAISPTLTLWWFLFSIANMAAPPTPNLAGEILIFLTAMKVGYPLAFMVGALSFISAGYNLYLYVASQHGSSSLSFCGTEEANCREHLLLLLHFIPLLALLILTMNFCLI